MIIARSPLRITLGGGGTDLPSYSRAHGGFLIAAAIDKHVYVSVQRSFAKGILLRYSRIEHVMDRRQIEHPIIREALTFLDINDQHLEITTMADLPAGTGLGSSGSLGTALLRALHRHVRRSSTTRELAEMACHIELDILKEPVGRQDPYVAAFGGINCYEFLPDDRVVVTPLQMDQLGLWAFSERVLLFSTEISREASTILKEQDDKTKTQAPDMIANLHYVKELGLQSKRALELGDIDAFGRLMHEHWEHKKQRSSRMSSPSIDAWYELARNSGAIGGKLIGAGGGGVLMFVASEPTKLRAAMLRTGLHEIRYDFDFIGTSMVIG
jgi:D-glycero-alpha-D-manno-heptose-7-phosphate kinase